jgi:phenylacetate-CoA ligase
MKRALTLKNLWDRVPAAAKVGLSPFFGAFPTSFWLGRRFRTSLRFVRQAEWWPADRSREHQLEQVKSIVSLAYRKTSYYRRAFRDIGFEPGGLKSLEHLTTLPTIDRQTVRDHLLDMCTVRPDSPGVDYVSTEGSSGMPLHFYIGSGRSAVEYAYLVAGWQRAGYRLDIPLAVIRGQVVPENRQGLHHSYDPILRRHYYSSFHMSDANLRRYLEHMSGIGPCFLLAYPSTVAALVRLIVHEGITVPPNIRGVLAGSEIVYTEDRASAERVFGVPYFSWYGHTEKLIMAAECEHSSDYHVWPTYGYFELLDEQGEPVTTPDQQGEIVGTGFINTVVPFIRYRTGDYATYVSDRCAACGRQHPIIRDIRGHRTQEMLIAGDGSEIPWTAVNMHDLTFHNVRQFQFHQDTPGTATLRLVTLPGFSEADRRRVLKGLQCKLEGRIHIQMEICDALPATKSGKAIYVDQHIEAAVAARAAPVPEPSRSTTSGR